jgi:hypothetical protein
MHRYSTDRMTAVGAHSLEGTVQRIDYRKRTLAVITDARVQHFALGPDSQLWFNGQRTIIRCFHPLDQVRIMYTSSENEPIARVLHLWAEE